MKCPNGQARSGKVWSGQVMQSYLGLKIVIQHSGCYTEATCEISYQSDHRVQSRYTNRLRAFRHFRYLSSHRNRFLENFLSARHSFWHTLWWCFTNDLCQMLLLFEEAKVFKNTIFYFDLERSKAVQRLWHFHSLNIYGWSLKIILVVVLAI